MNKKIKLVLSGSGTLYPAHVGAVKAMVESGHQIEEVCGVSGGAIVAAAIASGYKVDDLVKLVKQTLPAKNDLIDISLWSLLTKWGLIKGEKIEKMFEKFLVKTFADVKVPLKIVVANVNTGAPEFLSKETTPNLSIAKAVRASMAIPFVFCPVKLGQNTYVDGGWVSNFPIDVFGPGENVVGVRFDAAEKERKTISSIKDYIPALINTSIDANMSEDLEDARKACVIKVKTKHKNLNFGMTDKDVDEMVADGHRAALETIRPGKLRA